MSLEHFVADLLALSRPMDSVLTPRSLLRVIGRAAESLHTHLELSGVAVNIEAGDAIVPMAEPVMEAALRHLLLNAAQAMNGTGTIQIAVEHNGNTCSVSIRDNGPGIAPDVRTKMFDPFYTTRSRGRGLGLPIAKRAIEHHGGSLAIESEPGAGTTVLVKLPASSSQ